MLLALRSLYERKPMPAVPDALGGGIEWPYPRPLSERHWSAPTSLKLVIAKAASVGAVAKVGILKAKGVKNPTDDELLLLIAAEIF